MSIHINFQHLVGRIGPRGVELRYNPQGTPICSLILETDKVGRDGKVRTSYHRIEITGKNAEPEAERLEPGDEIEVEGEHQYRSTVDPKTQQKVVKCCLSTWGVSQHLPAVTTAAAD